MDIPATLVLIIVGAALVACMTNPRTGQALDAWASGFIGYRSYGWPRGVQEDDEIHFAFDALDRRATAHDAPAPPDAEPELIDLDGPAETIRLERLS